MNICDCCYLKLGVTQRTKLISRKHFNNIEYTIYIIISTLTDLKNQINNEYQLVESHC